MNGASWLPGVEQAVAAVHAACCPQRLLSDRNTLTLSCPLPGLDSVSVSCLRPSPPSVDREWSAPQRPVSSSAAARGWWWQPKSLPNSLPWVCHRCGLCCSSLLSFKRYTQRYVKLCFFIEGIFTWQTEALSLYREHRRDTRTVGPSQCRGEAAKRTFIVVSFLHSFNCLFVFSEVGLLPSCGQNQHSTLRQWKGWPKLPQVVVDQPLHHDGFIQPQYSSAGSPSRQPRALQPSGSTRLFKIGNLFGPFSP